MPDDVYELFVRAMREKKQIVCLYQCLRREICPVLLGRDGAEHKSLVFQFGGDTSRGRISPPGDWKCLRLEYVSDVHLREGPWRAGDRHSAAQTCMEIVEYDVNPQSPYHPVHRL